MKNYVHSLARMANPPFGVPLLFLMHLCILPDKSVSYLVGLELPNILHQSVCFTILGDFTWRVSDYEELVGVTNGR